MLLTGPDLRDLDLSGPVDWTHSLNAGRVLWLAPYGGGTRWPDVTGRTAGAALVGGPAWVPTPYGAGLLLDGSTQYADGPTLPAFATGRLACWFKPAVYTDAQLIYVGNPGTNDWCYILGQAGSSGWVCGVSNGGTFDFFIAGTVVVGAWTRLILDYDGTTVRLFVNGRLAGSHASTVVPNQFKTYFGQNGGGIQRANGVIADPGIWATHAPDPAAWAAADYEEGRRGYPTLLRRVRRRAWASVGGGAPTVVTVAGFAGGWAAVFGVGPAVQTGIGIGAGGGSLNGVGAVLASGVGAVYGAAQAVGTGVLVGAGVGRALGVGAAPGVGTPAATGTGAAPGTGTAGGAGVLTGTADGTALGYAVVFGDAGIIQVVTATAFAGGAGTAAGVGRPVFAVPGVTGGAGAAATPPTTFVTGRGAGAAGGVGTATGSVTAAGTGRAAGAGGGYAPDPSTVAVFGGAGVGAGAARAAGAALVAADAAALGYAGAVGTLHSEPTDGNGLVDGGLLVNPLVNGCRLIR